MNHESSGLSFPPPSRAALLPIPIPVPMHVHVQVPVEASLASRRDHAAGREGCLALMLDQIDYGVILVDASQRLMHANRAACAHLACQPGLRIVGDVLVADDARDQAALALAVKAASAGGLRRMLRIGSEAHGSMVAVVPLAESGVAPGATAGVMGVLLLMSRHAICSELSAQGFARDHGLSSAEGQVLMGLCMGQLPAEIALHQGVALSTVRTQIANIRLKTHSPSIRDLVQRVAQLPPMLSII